jgi:hypothetical protein
MTTPFWFNNPSILFNKDYILQLWPTPQMSFDAKLNAISRIVILLSVLGFLLTRNWNLIIIGIITLAIIYSIYKFRKQNIVSSLLKKEGFSVNPMGSNIKTNTNQNTNTDTTTIDNILKAGFHPTTKKNPFGNVLLTDIMDDPNRLAAAPSFNPNVYDDINKVSKKQTQMLNSGIKNTNKQLYGDLFDNYQFDRLLMQRFYSTANTRVCNDQGAYSKWLYGSMYSGKEDTPQGAWMRDKDNLRYILI